MKGFKLVPTLRASVAYLLVITFILTGVTFSRYITSTSSEDNARSAAIEKIAVLGENTDEVNFEKMIIPGVNIDKEVKVDFDGSEVDTFVYVKTELSSKWEQRNNNEFVIKYLDEDLISFEIDSKWNFLKKENDTTYVFYMEVPANTTLDENIIRNNTVYVSENITEDIISSLDDAFTKFKAVAIQTQDGLDALDVWNSN